MIAPTDGTDGGMLATVEVDGVGVIPAESEHLTRHRARMNLSSEQTYDGYGASLGLATVLVHDDDGQLLSSQTYGNWHLPVYDIDLPVTVDDTGTLSFPTVMCSRRQRRRLERRLERAGCQFFVVDLYETATMPLRLSPSGAHGERSIVIVASRTAGHVHLFDLTRRRTRDYLRTVTTLARAGIVDADWAALTRSRGFGAVLAPGCGPLKHP